MNDTTQHTDAPATSAWHLIDAEGRTLTDSHDQPITVGNLSQALCLFPTARAVVAEDGATLLATEDVFRKGGFAGLENRPTAKAEDEAWYGFRAAQLNEQAAAAQAQCEALAAYVGRETARIALGGGQ